MAIAFKAGEYRREKIEMTREEWKVGRINGLEISVGSKARGCYLGDKKW